eukprot:m.193136 g.193136  ORF g.193136 m.193136 type:complete len:103 (-) comp13655_c2_seq5:806-1114(-)
MDWFLCNKCIAAFSQNGKFVITRCGHIFCGKCVADATTCPECNAPLATLLIHKQMKSGREVMNDEELRVGGCCLVMFRIRLVSLLSAFANPFIFCWGLFLSI